LAASRSTAIPDDGVPSVRLRPAPPVRFPGACHPNSPHDGETDCNSPSHWDGDTFYLFNSAAFPWRSSGRDLLRLDGPRIEAKFDREISGHRWIESTWKDPAGPLYGWYHNEPADVCLETRPERHLTAPRIGAARSTDNGATWEDLGLILEGPPGALCCDTGNFYFAGGNGDFSVIPDEQGEHFYFLISTYPPDLAQQGVSVARMRVVDRDNPVGKAWKWRDGDWREPGLGGRVTPLFPVTADWHSGEPDAYWGASLHWNSHLQQYVALLNRAFDPRWAQEGVYVTFNPILADPTGWTAPQKILDREAIVSDPATPIGWYPQVIGTDTAQRETDQRAGRVARLFVHGHSRWEILFLQPGEGE
jgi:hypothetical protein